MANQIYDLVDRHLRKLDQELSKFKMELEADNAGITEVLEQRSLELDNPSSQMRMNVVVVFYLQMMIVWSRVEVALTLVLPVICQKVYCGVERI